MGTPGGELVSNNQSAVMRLRFLVLLFIGGARTIFAQQPALDPVQALKLAEAMCRQLPNVATILSRIEIQDPKELAQIQGAKAGVPRDYHVMDDVHDTLVQLGTYSLPCLVDLLADARWMPDPRDEPLLGAPVVGDVAYMILMEKGVEDVLPRLAHKDLEKMRMDDWFLWPSVGDHRLRLKAAVRAWLRKHPDCCAAPQVLRKPVSKAKFQMSAIELARARAKFARLRPGITPAEALRIAGKPDGTDQGEGKFGPHDINLLGLLALDRNENLAYIYFMERWTDEIGSRDPLRDRYVIVFFSAEGKLTRTFSNVESIPPVFPATYKEWLRVMWGYQPTKSSLSRGLNRN